MTARQESSYKLVKLTAGKTARITLKIHGAPLPKVTWYKDSKPLHAVDRISIFKEVLPHDPEHEFEYILKISKVKHSDEGKYTAVAITELVTEVDLSDVEIENTEVPSSINFTKTLTANHIIEVKVKDPSWQDVFKKVPSNITTFENLEATFYCETIKRSRVIWKKDQHVIDYSDKKYEIKSDGIKHELSIRNTSVNDNKNKFWACVGICHVGAYCEVVKFTADVDQKTLGDSDNLKVYIVSKPTENHFKIPHDGTLVLQHKLSEPNIDVTWQLNGKTLKSDSRVVCGSKNCLYTLRLNQVTKQDAGEIKFICGDCKQTQQNTITFECITPPEKPQKVKAFINPENQMLMTIRWEYHNSTDTIDEIYLERQSDKKSEWFRFFTGKGHQKSHEFYKPKAGTKIRLAFANVAGASEFLEVNLPKITEIDFVSELKDTVVELNQPLNLAVELTADNIPEENISWFIDGFQVDTGSYVEGTSDQVCLDQVQNIYILAISKVTQIGELNVRFEVEHNNKILSTECQVNIQEKPIQMVHELEPLEVVIGQASPATFNANLVEPLKSGENFYWYLNDEILQESDKNFKFENTKNKDFKLTIRNVEDLTLLVGK